MKIPDPLQFADPLQFLEMCWPHIMFYKEQREVIFSVRDNVETYCPAGNKLGKDFVSAFIALWFFMSRTPCRIVTSSATDRHLNVLWAEINNLIQTSKYPLTVTNGGNLIVNHHMIRKVVNGKVEPKSFIEGVVSDDVHCAALQGRHLPIKPSTLWIADEASALRASYWAMVRSWAHRLLVIGNTWPCENPFKFSVKGRPGSDDKGGDILSANGKYFYRKVIPIKATNSPNIRLSLAQIARGEEPTGEILIPGVMDYDEYTRHRKMMSKEEQCVCLDGEFYEGPGQYLYPVDWLNHSEELARKLRGKVRKAKAIGIDPAEGGDSTSMAAIDELGLIEQVTKKTPDTSVITGETIAFMNKHRVPAERVCFDYGGGGKQHVDRLRKQGYNVRAVHFGSAATADKKHGLTPLAKRKLQDEVRAVYKNRRIEMYDMLSIRMDPNGDSGGFAIDQKNVELRRQLAPMPKNHDGEGKMFLPPKNKPTKDSKVVTIRDLLGCSPDEADSLVLAVFAMDNRSQARTVRSLF